jgi:UDP-N-acetylmuramate dehydrogenase
VLGGGSNLLVSDEGFPGLVLRVGLRGIAVERKTARSIFTVAAGEDWDHFVARIVADECAGVECLSGIPGSVGGTPVQNVGAYGQEVSETIVRVRALDRRSLAFVSLANGECGFGYRCSIFNTTERDRFIVTSVEYSLVQNGAPRVAYEDLKRYFNDSKPTVAAVREATLAIRARKGMLIVPGEPDSLSAGSFFKNPILDSAALDRIATALAIEQASIPRYPSKDGKVKLPAAWLLEQAGFRKGYSLGRAGISSRHTLALINRDHAKAADVIALRDKIVDTVGRRFGVCLEPEPVWVG